jgi:hypothetical protein
MTAALAVFLAGLALIATASLLVVGPLFRPAGPGASPSAEGSEGERWERQKRQALAAIKEAELDYQMGKLSDEDLATMRARFEARALEAMAALGQGKGRQG